ncbi:MAG: hypothetical protein M1510_10530 [Nitrospirae bacterium]|nr:hypothetical protein [Nitrospirota bacterium]MCL5238806.1 hypothetical protein [Nitrospirota bacterium]
MNAIAGVFKMYKNISRVLASDMATKRRGLCIKKEHGNDAVCTGGKGEV